MYVVYVVRVMRMVRVLEMAGVGDGRGWGVRGRLRCGVGGGGAAVLCVWWGGGGMTHGGVAWVSEHEGHGRGRIVRRAV